MSLVKSGQTILLRWLTVFLVLLSAFVMGTTLAYAQSTGGRLLKQSTESSPVQPLTATELADLGDPFFNLVLKDRADATNLATIEALIQPNDKLRETFVVDERLQDFSPGQTRRAVLAFRGKNNNEFLSPNVMLSVKFDSDNFSDTPELIEAWGWDDNRGRFNYYQLDREQTGSLSWKFRGSSDGADNLSPQAREGTCMLCHINGAPVMKELLLPWNNWHDAESVHYLEPGHPNSWSVASDRKLDSDRLKPAYALFSSIVPAIRQFNSRRIDALTHSVGDTVQVIDGKRLLKPLFETTEFNIISSEQTSRLHPFSSSTDLPTKEIQIPNSFFLNANLIAGGGLLNYQGLDITESREFASVAIQPADYENLVQAAGVKLADRQPGDAHFAWLVPEPSHIDNDIVSQLIEREILPREFVAAVMAIDLETPILSPARKKLLDFVPDRFQIKPDNDLMPQTIAALEQANPPNESPENEFLEILKSEDPVALLRNKVNEYLNREKALLDNPDTKFTELNRLYALAVERRKAILNDEILGSLDETGGKLLFPVP